MYINIAMGTWLVEVRVGGLEFKLVLNLSLFSFHIWKIKNMKNKNGGLDWTLPIPLFITYFDICEPPKFIELDSFRRAWIWVAMVLLSSFVS